MFKSCVVWQNLEWQEDAAGHCSVKPNVVNSDYLSTMPTDSSRSSVTQPSVTVPCLFTTIRRSRRRLPSPVIIHCWCSDRATPTTNTERIVKGTRLTGVH